MNSDINSSVASPAVVTPKTNAPILPVLNTAPFVPAKARSPRAAKKPAAATLVASAK